CPQPQNWIERYVRAWGHAPLQTGEKELELFPHCRKRQAFRPARLRFDNCGSTFVLVAQKVESNRAQLFGRLSLATGTGESDSFGRAIAPDTNCPRQQRVARDLARDAAPIELEDNFVSRHLAQIVRVGLAFLDHSQFTGRKVQLTQQPPASASIEVE